MTVRWLTAFIDLPAPVFEDGCAFWAAVTGYTLSGRRGDNDQFVTEALDAKVVRVTSDWTTLLGPAGDEYCVTRRNPDTGILG